jgi:hypothetical protein
MLTVKPWKYFQRFKAKLELLLSVSLTLQFIHKNDSISWLHENSFYGLPTL